MGEHDVLTLPELHDLLSERQDVWRQLASLANNANKIEALKGTFREVDAASLVDTENTVMPTSIPATIAAVEQALKEDAQIGEEITQREHELGSLATRVRVMFVAAGLMLLLLIVVLASQIR